jgi:transcription-repair coupling factor (superfamily II helicase)
VLDLATAFPAPGRRTLTSLPEGYDALIIAHLAQQAGEGRDLLHICRDDVRLDQLAQAVHFFAPEVEILEFPAWDCVPYDRASPTTEVVSRRIDTLTKLALPRNAGRAKGEAAPPRVILATVAAATQRVPKASVFRRSVFPIIAGKDTNVDALMGYLSRNGYQRAEQVMEAGEYAVRGGIIDLFAPGGTEPYRLDFFGDEVDSIRTFDPISQRTTGTAKTVALKPVSEVVLDDDAVSRFRSNYRELFGTVDKNDLLYEAVSDKRKMQGMEHWLPLFHEGLDTLFAYLPDALITLDHQADDAWTARVDLIREYFDARVTMEKQGSDDGGIVYHPVHPERLYMTPEEFPRLLASFPCLDFTPFAAPDFSPDSESADGRSGHSFADVRARPGENLYDAVRQHVVAEQEKGRRVILAAYSLGSRDRLSGVLRDHGLPGLTAVESWVEALELPAKKVPVIVLGLEHGFETPDLAVVAEPDILGDRLARPAKKKRKADKFIQDASALSEGDLVVHVEHGIGRYDGLETLSIANAPHDCVRLIYDGGDKLFLPVENIDVLSRFGSETAGVSLDRLGSPAWQARKAKLKERIRDMAHQLIQVAALRHMKKADSLNAPDGLYDEFCARFPYVETEDQLKAISDTLDDMGSGRPMDRLVCGDVGFGKTEVALRAAFVAAMSGLQVAVVVPTTLLARQHYLAFADRFAGLPVQVAQLSRLVTAKQATKTKEGIANGSIDIVVGTHAVVAKSVNFKRLGLLIVDEEQHFGVAHKERLKQLKTDVHVLTLSATPIPRTLQLALTGVRELSIIATPPVDRLAVRTFVLPFDGVVIREALLRERFRGGQSFYVCPRLADIDQVADRLSKLVPEIKTVVAHGQMAPTQLEEVMTAFANGEYDVLLATNIIESGLDMPRVNTIVIHRADMFGLGQLYQLRGRVGRGKQRSYAYMTLPPGRKMTPAAEKRLTVMQTLDTLGAGFSLASHDLDIRGAGNLLGDEQSGHIKEVGIELYQHLLEEAVAAARQGEGLGEVSEDWAPQIQLGMPVLIPEAYVKDLGVRLGLYRRIADVTDASELEALAVELIDRFGPLPQEVENLLEIIAIKTLCRTANVEKLDAGPKGGVLTFRDNQFPNPAGLIRFISQNIALVKLRPDHKLVYMRNWEAPDKRVAGSRRLLEQLAAIATEEG